MFLKKITNSALILASLFLLLFAFEIVRFEKINKSISISIFGNYAYAEEDDDDDERDEDGKDESSKAQESGSSNATPKETVQIIKLPDQIITKTILETEYEPDTDGDGIIDKDDPHPTIAEIYIVSDNNLNGMDDNYEIF